MTYWEIRNIIEIIQLNHLELCWFSIMAYIVHVLAQFQATLLDNLNDIPDFPTSDYVHIKQISRLT